MWNPIRVAAVVGVWQIACVSLAQEPSAPAHRINFRLTTYSLVLDPDVQHELRLSNEQVDSAARVKPSRPIPIVPNATPAQRDEFRMAQAAMCERAEKYVEDSLTPEQKSRFWQIHTQAVGFSAFWDAEIQIKLKLTDEQKKAILELRKALNTDRIDLGKKAKNNDDHIQKERDLLADYVKKAQGLLTDDQRAIYKKLVGEPFKLKNYVPM